MTLLWFAGIILKLMGGHGQSPSSTLIRVVTLDSPYILLSLTSIQMKSFNYNFVLTGLQAENWESLPRQLRWNSFVALFLCFADFVFASSFLFFDLRFYFDWYLADFSTWIIIFCQCMLRPNFLLRLSILMILLRLNTLSPTWCQCLSTWRKTSRWAM